jgi:hypothetical protein
MMGLNPLKLCLKNEWDSWIKDIRIKDNLMKENGETWKLAYTFRNICSKTKKNPSSFIP